jgi:hypothetical protein
MPLLGQREIGGLGCNHVFFFEKEEEKEEKRVGGEWYGAKEIKSSEEKITEQTVESLLGDPEIS